MYNELGRTGLKHYSGTLYEEWLPDLQGRKGIAVYTEMADSDPVIGGSLYAIEALLRSVPWAVEPASGDPADIEMADFLDECMHDMSHTWEDFISEVLTMIRYGWAYFEIVYKKRDGDKPNRGTTSRYEDSLIGWRKFAIRSQDTLFRWEIAKNGRIKGLVQMPQPTGSLDNVPAGVGSSDQGTNLIRIPIEKALLFRTTSWKNSPEGRSLLRSSYRPWYFGKRVEEIEAIGIERDLAGIPVAWVPPEIIATTRTEEQLATYNYAKDIVTKTKQDEQQGIIWPLAYDENGNKVYDLTLMSTQGRRAFDTGAIVQRYNQQKAMSMLADFILLGHEAVGSFALSSDKTELFSVALGSILDSIEDVLNRHAVPRLFRANGLPTGERMPRFRHGDIEKPDLANLIQYVQGLANAGAPIFPDIVLENHLRGVADLPPISEEDRERIQQEQAMQQQAMMGGMPPTLGLGGSPQSQGKPMVGFPGGNDDKPKPSKPPSESSIPNEGGRPTNASTVQR